MVYMITGWQALKTPRFAGTTFKTKVTVLIAARDEEKGIAATIEDILAQDYPKELTEIIIVDDHSTDRTAEIISNYAGRGVKLLRLTDTTVLNSYKKKAISEAIKLSTGDLMVATDADCRMGNYWLSKIVAYYETYNPVMISSPVTFFKERSFFERLQTLEFTFLIGIGASFIGNGYASTCNGANLAYRKDIFNQVGGFKGIDDLASGDDELLLQKIAALYPKRIGFLKASEAIVYTYAKHDLSSFLLQRKRWASKSTRYKDKKVIAFGVGIWAFYVSVLLGFILSFFYDDFYPVFICIVALKFFFETLFVTPILSFFNRKALLLLMPVLFPLHIIYISYIGLAGNARQYVWKGRMVK